MKKALIFSDSHGKNENMLDVIKRFPEVEAIFHAGDIEGGADRLREAVDCPVYIVRGNCDFTPKLSPNLTVEFGAKKIAICHGHRYLDLGGLDKLKYWALEREADVVIFGHTHIPYLEQGGKLTVINPGSISRPRQDKRIPTYAIMEIGTDGQFHFSLCEYR
ncbi:MAG: metallophosphoesterase [Lachnospiraceae bacterium]|nr:metallophosphoesterase [Lachnospiraceae bacterium]